MFIFQIWAKHVLDGYLGVVVKMTARWRNLKEALADLD